MPTRIPKQQWDLPAGIHTLTGEPATLKEILDPKVPTASFRDLSKRRQVEIVTARLRRQSSFSMWSLGGLRSKISKRRAIAEVRERTPIGEALMKIEERVIALLEDTATDRQARRRQARTRGGE